MYELIQVSDHDYYVDCPAKIGIVTLGGGQAVTIDSGSDKDAAKKVLRHIEALGCTLTAVYNTHSHADHIGGNRFLQTKTGCRIYAPGMEAVYTGCPALESMTLYGGKPIRELETKFLLAQDSACEPLTPEALPGGVTAVPLPGHSFDMVGYLTAEGTLYAADSVSSRETLEKYGLSYLWEPYQFMESLEKLKTIGAKRFVPSHAAPTEDIAPLCACNLERVQRVLDDIAGLTGEGRTFEELLTLLFDRYGMTMNESQYALIGSTLRSMLSAMKARGLLAVTFDQNRMLWRRCD